MPRKKANDRELNDLKSLIKTSLQWQRLYIEHLQIDVKRLEMIVAKCWADLEDLEDLEKKENRTDGHATAGNLPPAAGPEG